MPKCFHTGLDTRMCGHCNGSHALEREPFGGMRRSDEPRLVKGRDKVEWQGIGQNLVPPKHVLPVTTDALTQLRRVDTRLSVTDSRQVIAEKDGREIVVTEHDTREIPISVRVRLAPLADAPVNIPVTLGIAPRSCNRPAGFSAWGKSQDMRTLQGLIKGVRK